MTVSDAIIAKINEHCFISVSISEKSNLYTDLGFDSLSFIDLLMELEDMYSITFDIMEMETCLQVSRLIAITETKIKERGQGDD